MTKGTFDYLIGGYRAFIGDPLEHIINKSIKLVFWSEKSKLAEISPTPKEDDKNLLCNQKPTALISNVAKICEKIIYNRISSFPSKHNILSK